jgi:histidinol-phosphatase (PHP family)
MVDAHIHLDKVELSKQTVEKIVAKAIERNINEIYLLQHTNAFIEFMPIYDEMKKYNNYQRQWVETKEQKAIPISKYIEFIKNMKKTDFPIKIKYGLEVCYSQIFEKHISEITGYYDFDFLVGSVHTIDGWAFSHLKQKWSKNDVSIEKIYKRYYELMQKLIESKIFDGLAHPNSLGCFGVFPENNFSNAYEKLAISLIKGNMYTEINTGLVINYGRNDFGINMDMINIFKRNGVNILTASDAHKPDDVGLFIEDVQKYLK